MPLNTFGTNTSYDIIKGANFQSIIDFGEQKVWDAVAVTLNAYNALVQDQLKDFVTDTTERLTMYGSTTSNFRFQEMDEMGTPQAQKGKPGAIIGLPLKDYQAAIAWNRRYMQNHSPSDLAGQVDQVLIGDVLLLQYNIQKTLFTGVNYSTTDPLIDHQEAFPIPVRALVNADGLPIPPGQNGRRFDPTTHTHYMAINGVTNTWLRAVIENVIEHYNRGSAVIFISSSDETSISALADFKAFTYATVIKSANQEYGQGVLDEIDIYNRQIGWFRGAAVWTKPWMPAGYVFAFMKGNPAPIARRIRAANPMGTNGGPAATNAGELFVSFEDESHPLYAKAWEREYGMGIKERTNGVVGYMGGNTYVAPALTY